MLPSVFLEAFKDSSKSAFAFVQRAMSIERTCGMKLAYTADNQPHICRGKWTNCHINEKCQITEVTRKRRRILKWQPAISMKNIKLQMLQEYKKDEKDSKWQLARIDEKY
jgi:hypothetical protein